MYNRPTRVVDVDIQEDTNLLSFIVDELGGTVFAMQAIDKSFDLIDRFFPNKNVRKVTAAGRSFLPFILTTHRILTSWNNWRKAQNINAADKKLLSIAKLLRIPKNRQQYFCDCFDSEYIDVGNDILNWLLSQPKTDKLKVVSVTDIHGNSQITVNNNSSQYITIDWSGNYVVIEILYNSNTTSISTIIYYDYDVMSSEDCQNFQLAMYEAFAQCYDTKNNVMYYSTRGITTRPRGKSSFTIKQIDYQQLVNEIRSVISAGIKRGYGIGGPPGTGKTSAILELENDLRDIPFVYINATAFRDADIIGVNRIFRFIRTISPCIAVLEDIDTFDLGNKNMKLGEILEEIDTVKNDNPVVFIVTFNESDKVHYSLLGRPGRIDQVFLIDIPHSCNMVREVILNRIEFKKNNSLVHDFDDIKNSTIERILINRFSQADICEIVDKCILNNKSINNENMLWSIEQIELTKQAIKRCKFVNNMEEEENE